MFSLSKSFTSTAVGLAISEGKLSLDDPVLKFFPDEAPANPSKNLLSMRVRDLLQDGDRAPGRGPEWFPIRRKGGPGPRLPRASGAGYSGHAFRLQHCGDLHAVGHRPEGDRPDRAGLPWAAAVRTARASETPSGTRAPRGFHSAGIGLHLRTEDIACFGQLYLQKGQWQGKQLIPADWVQAATSLQIANGSDPDERLEPGILLPVLALPARGLPGRRRIRPVLHRDARVRHGRRDHERDGRPAGGPEPRLGQDPSRARSIRAAGGCRGRCQACC